MILDKIRLQKNIHIFYFENSNTKRSTTNFSKNYDFSVKTLLSLNFWCFTKINM